MFTPPQRSAPHDIKSKRLMIYVRSLNGAARAGLASGAGLRRKICDCVTNIILSGPGCLLPRHGPCVMRNAAQLRGQTFPQFK